MKKALTALFTVAEELAKLAKSSLPEIREGEVINREWLKDGIYCRETIFDGKVYKAQFDFRQRTTKILCQSTC